MVIASGHASCRASREGHLLDIGGHLGHGVVVRMVFIRRHGGELTGEGANDWMPDEPKSA